MEGGQFLKQFDYKQKLEKQNMKIKYSSNETFKNIIAI